MVCSKLGIYVVFAAARFHFNSKKLAMLACGAKRAHF